MLDTGYHFTKGKLAPKIVYFVLKQELLNFSETAPWLLFTLSKQVIFKQDKFTDRYKFTSVLLLTKHPPIHFPLPLSERTNLSPRPLL